MPPGYSSQVVHETTRRARCWLDRHYRRDIDRQRENKKKGSNQDTNNKVERSKLTKLGEFKEGGREGRRVELVEKRKKEEGRLCLVCLPGQHYAINMPRIYSLALAQHSFPSYIPLECWYYYTGYHTTLSSQRFYIIHLFDCFWRQYNRMVIANTHAVFNPNPNASEPLRPSLAVGNIYTPGAN